jgi:hypothetical protein
MDFNDKYIDELIELRRVARETKDWKLSDELRNYLDEKLIFIFDTKEGQGIYYLPPSYFDRRDKDPKTTNMNNRQYVEYRIQEDIRAEKGFDAWLYSIQKSTK